jgi:hypothetical protein
VPGAHHIERLTYCLYQLLFRRGPGDPQQPLYLSLPYQTIWYPLEEHFSHAAGQQCMEALSHGVCKTKVTRWFSYLLYRYWTKGKK